MLRSTLYLFLTALALGSVVSHGFAEDAAPAQNSKPAAQDTKPANAAQPAQNAAPAQKSKPTAQNAKPANGAQPAQNSAPQAQNNAPQMQATSTTGTNPAQKVSTEASTPTKVIWPFEGMTGYVDKQAAQRGFQIYSQVCSVCHSMNLVAYRDLSKIGFSEAEIKAIAAQKQVADTDDNGQPVQRPGAPSDHFVPPFPNEKASRAANNGAYPPDLSLIIKAREFGPDYVYSILTGFGTAPANEPAVANKYYNAYFEGHWISMPPPLHDNIVTYQDGTPSDIDHMARDVVVFLQWAAEPEMQQRHEMGLKVLVFLFIMTGFFYVAKKRVWKKAGH